MTITSEQRAQVEDAAKALASQLNLAYFDTREPIDITPLVGKLTVQGMQAYGIAPVALDGNRLTLAISNATNRDLITPLIHRLNGYEVQIVFTSDFGWARLMNRYAIADNQNVLESGNFDSFAQTVNNIEPKFMFEPVAQLAYQLGASDIHIEPSADAARIRFRMDGTLHPIITIPKDRYDLFTSDLQMRAGVKWGADVPQGGRISVQAINPDGDVVDVNMRLETIPSLHGQDVVIRLFNLSVKYLNLDNLKMTGRQRDTLLKAVSHPRGMVLTVGPTGSGKTSTLYSIMNHLNSEEVKIVTLEDPVEYELDGISQIPVRSDDQQLFMEKLRAVLREDPNIIMIGEIRDADTAKTSLQAALTGHLVLSTFHASSAAAAVTRLMDMIGQNPLLASSIRLIIAQRLVRQLCEDCKQPRQPTKDELLEIKTVFESMPAEARPKIDNVQLFDPKGCNKCHNFGYKGRLSVIEQMPMTPTLEKVISAGTAATTAPAIEQAAIADGMVTLMQDGMLKVIQGRTTLAEVYAAVGE